MDYEKKYKDALERAKKLYGKYCINNVLESIFPELKEREDEKIRKTIIAHIKDMRVYDTYYDVTPDEMVVWLEKQGERKPEWTQEDSSMQLMLMRDIEHVSFISKDGKDERIMWLNKLDDSFIKV